MHQPGNYVSALPQLDLHKQLATLTPAANTPTHGRSPRSTHSRSSHNTSPAARLMPAPNTLTAIPPNTGRSFSFTGSQRGHDIFVPRGPQDHVYGKEPIKIFRDCLRVFLVYSDVYGPLLKLVMREYNAAVHWWSKKKDDERVSLAFSKIEEANDSFRRERDEVARELLNNTELTELREQIEESAAQIEKLTNECQFLQEENSRLAPMVKDLQARLNARDKDVQDLRNQIFEISTMAAEGDNARDIAQEKSHQAMLQEIIAQGEEEKYDLITQLKETTEKLKAMEDGKVDETELIDHLKSQVADKDNEILDVEKQLETAHAEAADLEAQVVQLKIELEAASKKKGTQLCSKCAGGEGGGGSKPNRFGGAFGGAFGGSKSTAAKNLGAQAWPDHVRRYAVTLWDNFSKGLDSNERISWADIHKIWISVDPAIVPDIEGLLDALGRKPSEPDIAGQELLMALKAVFAPK